MHVFGSSTLRIGAKSLLMLNNHIAKSSNSQPTRCTGVDILTLYVKYLLQEEPRVFECMFDIIVCRVEEKHLASAISLMICLDISQRKKAMIINSIYTIKY